jgi:hypothetical protein
MLNRPHNAKYQAENGGYGRRTPIALKHFDSHLRGVDTIALSTVDGDRANFLAFDLDDRFEVRLSIFADVLSRRGLDRASFATSGSSPGRGKVVVTLAKTVPKLDAIRLVREIRSDLFAHEDFGGVAMSDFATFPQNGDGGHVRLLGINRRRLRSRALIEAPLDLNGDLSDLVYLEPAALTPTSRPRNRSGSLSRWARELIDSPCSMGTPELMKAQIRLAAELVALYGSDDAEVRLPAMFQRIAEQSPNLSRSSLRNLHRRDNVRRFIGYASQSAANNGNHRVPDCIWLPKLSQDAPKPALRVYRALYEYVREVGLDWNCFGITYARIAELAEYAGKPKARDAVSLAIDARLLVQLDPGEPKRSGFDGFCGLYALVGNHNNPALAAAAGSSTAMYLKRLADRGRLGLVAARPTIERVTTQ